MWVQGAHGAEIPECCDICKPASLAGNPSRKSLEAGRVLGCVQTCPARLLPGTSGCSGGRGELGVPPGVAGAVTVQDEPAILCPCSLLGCWDGRNGGRGLFPSSPSGCLQWERWFCPYFLAPCGIHPLRWAHQAGCTSGRQLWDAGMPSFPPLNPSQGSQGSGGQVFRFGFGSPSPWGWMCPHPHHHLGPCA